jgi:internalin A
MLCSDVIWHALALAAAVGVTTGETGSAEQGEVEDPCAAPARPIPPRQLTAFEVDPSDTRLLSSDRERSDPLAVLVPADRGIVDTPRSRVPLSELPEGAPHEMVAASLAHIDALRQLDLGKSGLRDLTPLGHLQNVEQLTLYDTAVSDLRPLAGWATLQMLDLRTTPVADVAPLAGMPFLQRLALDETNVKELRPLRTLRCLEQLGLRDTPVVDLRPLVKLERLRELHLDGSAVASLRSLARMRQLEVLTVSYTSVRDIRPLARLSSLKVLSLEGSKVKDLRPLYGLKQLDVVDIRGLPLEVSDVDALVDALPFTTVYTTVYEDAERRRQEAEAVMRLARARFELAKTMWRGGSKLHEARALAEKALNGFRSAGTEAAARLEAETLEWLRSHTIP